MHRSVIRRLQVASVLLPVVLSAVAAPVLAQSAPLAVAPEPGSPVALVGEAIVYFADESGLSAVAEGEFNPFGIDGEALLQHVGLFFVSVDFEGEEVHEGEIAIFPQFRTPFQAFDPGPLTPRMIPFALRKGGVCHAGYVAGDPLPDIVMQVDIGDLGCHALTVESLLTASYAAPAKGLADVAAALVAAGIAEPAEAPALPPVELTDTAVSNFDPAFPTALDLEVIAWAAYNAAYARASTDGDIFARDDAAAEALRAEMLTEIRREGFEGVPVLPALSPEGARACAEPGATVLRVGVTPSGEGIFIAAASEMMVAAQEYDPASGAEMSVTGARDCATSGLGRAGPASF